MPSDLQNSDLLQRVQARLQIDLHPSALAAVDQGVRDHLNALLLQYNEEFGGVLLAYSNERVLTHSAVVHPYFPLLRLHVAVEFVLFKPQPGSRVVGTVTKLSDGYIGLLVLGFMNAVVRADQVRTDLHYLPHEGCWASAKRPDHRIAVGDAVAFTVSALEQDGPFLALAGALLDKGTGNVTHAKAVGGGKKRAKVREGGEAAKGSAAAGADGQPGAPDVPRGEGTQGGAAAAAAGKPAKSKAAHNKKKRKSADGGEEEAKGGGAGQKEAKSVKKKRSKEAATAAS